MNLDPLYIVFLVCVGVLLFTLAYYLFTWSARHGRRDEPEPDTRGKPGEAGYCPICGTRLAGGAQIKSAVYPGKDERMCHIFGCPACHPYPADTAKRTCPVCRKPLPPEEYLIARMFERPGHKNHIHILGCTRCRFSRK